MLSSICFMPASLTPQSLPPGAPTMAMYLSDSTVVTCMRAGLYQTKKGLLVRRGSLRSRKSMTLAEISSSTVFDRSSVSGPSSLQRLVRRRAVRGLAPKHWTRRRQAGCRLGVHRAGHLGDAGDRRVPARRRDVLHQGCLVDVGEAHLLHCVEVIEVAPVFLEAVRGRQRVGVVAQVVLAELAGVVAEIEQELGERRGAGPQVGRAARQLRRDHAGAQRIHAGEEGIAPGGAALHGEVVHELGTLTPDAVDVGCFAKPKAFMVDAGLHPADVVAHDEEDVGLLLLLRGYWRARHHHGSKRCQQTEPDVSDHAHALFSSLAARNGPTAWCPTALIDATRASASEQNHLCGIIHRMHSKGIGCRSGPRRLNQGGPRHAFETKDHVHRDQRRRGDVRVKPGTDFNLGERLDLVACVRAMGTVAPAAVCATQTAKRFMSHSPHRDGAWHPSRGLLRRSALNRYVYRFATLQRAFCKSLLAKHSDN